MKSINEGSLKLELQDLQCRRLTCNWGWEFGSIHGKADVRDWSAVDAGFVKIICKPALTRKKDKRRILLVNWSVYNAETTGSKRCVFLLCSAVRTLRRLSYVACCMRSYFDQQTHAGILKVKPDVHWCAANICDERALNDSGLLPGLWY